MGNNLEKQLAGWKVVELVIRKELKLVVWMGSLTVDWRVLNLA